MAKRFYFDTSIWLDLFENRDEPNFPKGTWARELIKNIAGDEHELVYSDLNLIELEEIGYSYYELENLLKSFSLLLIFIESNSNQIKRAKDLSAKRLVPRKDALHALIARDNECILITFDNHFQSLKDIIIPHKTNEFI